MLDYPTPTQQCTPIGALVAPQFDRPPFYDLGRITGWPDPEHVAVSWGGGAPMPYTLDQIKVIEPLRPVVFTGSAGL